MSDAVILTLNPKVSGLSSAVTWLREHGVSVRRIAGILGISEAHVRQLDFRGQWRIRQPGILHRLEDPLRPPADPFGPVPDNIRKVVKIRSQIDSWMVRPGPSVRRRVEELESQVEQLGTEFWSGVRHGVGLKRFGNILTQIGSPADYRRIRILARVRQLLAETYAHAGYSSSAIEQALVSLLLSRAAHESSGEA